MNQNEMYQVFKDCAKLLPKETSNNINDLVNLYMDNKGNYYEDAYFSVIMLHYWPKITRMYKKSQPYATFEDAYDWMIESIMQAICMQQWKDPNNKLYDDPNAPDKVINRIVVCVRANWFQAQNRFSRKINMNILSTDAFTDQYEGLESVEWIPITQSTSSEESNPVYGIVRSLFSSLNYEKAFVLDIVLFDGGDSEKDIIETFKSKLDNIYLEQFANRYGIDISHVNKAAEYIRNKSTKELKDCVAERLKEIRTQLNIKDWIHV